MKKALAKARSAVEAVRDLYGTLPRSRRVAVLGCAGGSLLLFAILSAPGAGSAPADRTAGAPGSGVGPAEESAADAAAAGDAPTGSAAPGLFAFMELPEKTQMWQEAATIRRLEAKIRSSNVRSATVMYSHRTGSRAWLDRSVGDTAAVKLDLAPGVETLARNEADAIRALVAGALRLSAENVSIVDGRNRLYPAGSGSTSPDAADDEERWRELIRTEVLRHCAPFAGPSEVHVSVSAYVSREQVEIHKEEYDPESSVPEERIDRVERVEEDLPGHPVSGGIGACPAESPRRTVVKSRIEERFRTARSTTSTRVPQGSLRSVGVLALFDSKAVLAGMPVEDPNDARLSEWVALREAELRDLLSAYPDVSVRVAVHPFRGPVEDVPSRLASVLPPGLGTTSPLVVSSDGPSGFPAWAGRLTVWIGLIAVGFLSWQLVRSLGANRGLRAVPGRWSAAAATPGAPAGPRGGAGESRPHRARGGLGDGLLSDVDESSARVRLRPDVAAAVVRFWLTREGDEAPEGAVRA